MIISAMITRPGGRCMAEDKRRSRGIQTRFLGRHVAARQATTRDVCAVAAVDSAVEDARAQPATPPLAIRLVPRQATSYPPHTRPAWKSQPTGGDMAQIVGVHGIGQQAKGSHILRHEWLPPLLDGLEIASRHQGARLAEPSFAAVSYGDIFRGPSRTLAPGDPLISTSELDRLELEILYAWRQGAADSDPAVVGAEESTLALEGRSAHAALRALTTCRFFRGITKRALLFDLRQVRLYLTDKPVRDAVQTRLADAVTSETRVLIGHSLGSVVCYEALCAHPEWEIQTFVSLGSPLGIPFPILDNLRPRPQFSGGMRASVQGQWPGRVKSWKNVADLRDVVALVKDLRPVFGRGVTNSLIENGAHAHAVAPYLTSDVVGAAILEGLPNEP